MVFFSYHLPKIHDPLRIFPKLTIKNFNLKGACTYELLNIHVCVCVCTCTHLWHTSQRPEAEVILYSFDTESLIESEHTHIHTHGISQMAYGVK